MNKNVRNKFTLHSIQQLRKLTPVKQFLPDKKSRTGEMLSGFEENKNSFPTDADLSLRAETSLITLLRFGNKSSLTISAFNVPS